MIKKTIAYKIFYKTFAKQCLRFGLRHSAWIGGILCFSGCAALQYDLGKAEALMAQGDRASALVHYQQLAEFGEPEAKINLAKLYSESDDDQSALTWYEAALADGYYEARLQIARLRAGSDDALVLDRDLARKSFIELINEGETKAYSGLAKLLASNNRAQQPSSTFLDGLADSGWRMLVSQAKGGDHAACYLAAHRLSQTLSVKTNESDDAQKSNVTTAFEFYRCALPRYPDVIQPLAELAHRHNFLGGFDAVSSVLESLVERNREVREQRNSTATKARVTDGQLSLQQRRTLRAIRRLSQVIKNGGFSGWGVKHQMRLYMAAVQIDERYTLRLAELYMSSPELGKQGDEVLALLSDCGPNLLPSCQALAAKMHLFGLLVVQDPWRAETILLSLEPEDVQVQYLLGVLYSRGYLGEPNLKVALPYLHNAAVAGNKRADKELYHVYQNGMGLPRDRSRAFVHLVLSGVGEKRLLARATKHGVTLEQMNVIRRQAAAEALRRNSINVDNTNET